MRLQTFVSVHYVRSEELSEMLMENIITKYTCLAVMIMDQNSAFVSSLVSY